MRIEARGKINWTLDITGIREDGFHYMDMLMQPVSLCDYVTINMSDTLTLNMTGYPKIRADETNIAMKAARELKKAADVGYGAAIMIEKHIPVGAGMAGGSADAAAVLAGLNHLWRIGLKEQELENIALSLGADVPFCLRGGLKRTTGIGEKMTDIPCKNLYWLVVVQPCHGLNTGEVFAEWNGKETKLPDTDLAQTALMNGSTGLLQQCLGNVLQPVSERLRPPIRDAIERLKELGAITALMTGSGSAVYGVFRNAKTARNAETVLLRKWNRTFMCHTCYESLIIDDRKY